MGQGDPRRRSQGGLSKHPPPSAGEPEGTAHSGGEDVIKAEGCMRKRVALPKAVAKIYEAVAELEASYPDRKFTPDGHLVGSIGEVVAAEALSLTLHPASYPNHDAFGEGGDVQIKMVGRSGRNIALYGNCERLVVLKIVSESEAEIIYDDLGEPI
jgi:hypothetical protein